MNTAIALEDIRKSLNQREILRGISFVVGKGDIFGYLGPNGAGKTTSIRILLGLFKPDSGEVDVLGKDISKEETRKHMGFLLEGDGLYDSLTGEENLEYYAQLYGVTDPAERIDRVLRLVGLKNRSGDRVGTYSKGMRQRLGLARSMVHDPEILILDEPTSGLDPTAQIEIRELLLNIAADGRTIFFSSHNLDEVERICNRIALIHNGEIKLYGSLAELRQGRDKSVAIETSGITELQLKKLNENPGLGFKEKKGNILMFTLSEGISVPDIVNTLSGSGIGIENIIKKEASLEEIYSRILKEAEIS